MATKSQLEMALQRLIRLMEQSLKMADDDLESRPGRVRARECQELYDKCQSALKYAKQTMNL